MNEQTIGLLEKLSGKLGIAAQVLWSALIKQAPITAVVDLIVMLFFIMLAIWGFKFAQKKTNNEDCESEAAFLAWLIWGFYVAMITLIIGLSLSNTISGLVNPEYWALKEILSAIK